MSVLKPAPSIHDTLLSPAPISNIEEAKDSAVIIKNSVRATPDTKKHISTPIRQSRRALDIFKSVDFITLLEALFLIFIAFVIFRLLNRSSKSTLARRLPLFSTHLVPALKAITIILIAYLVINLIFDMSKEILLGLLIIVIITMALASVPVIKNLIGGFILTYNPPFGKGDIIHVQEYTGKVVEVNLRHTTIVTDNGSNVSLPNSIFLSKPVENINIGNREQKITINIDLPSSMEHDRIIKILKEAALSNPYLYTRKKVEVFLKKSDALDNTNTYEVNFYIFDRQFYDESLNHFNQTVANKIKSVN
ncbi:mechanosensitive ion channel domain-containing protein [Melioribacter sp. OK-6-Me]|uniref:mechanosensitive ion channel domain-containing protein n=1 Tax=unclassified Melioribacter TaxID=2627329 RepID=UPI003ED922A1